MKIYQNKFVDEPIKFIGRAISKNRDKRLAKILEGKIYHDIKIIKKKQKPINFICVSWQILKRKKNGKT